MNPIAIEKQSIQEHEPATSLGVSDWYYSLPTSNPNDSVLLPDWGQHARDRKLRELYRNQYAWLAQSAVSALVRKVKQTPWQLMGGPNLTTYFQGVLQEADFNDGWGQFLSRVLLDFSTCDYGAYIEIIGGGRADKPLKGRVRGVAHLDSLRCIPTGNLEFPVVYWSRRSGTMHRIHYTRIYRLVDMPDGDESRFGAGMCALSRAISMMQQQLNLMKYTNGMLEDVPANGLLFLPPGLSTQVYNEMMTEYKLRRETQGYKGPVALGTSSSEAVKAEYQSFSMAPDGFDFATYVDIAVNVFAAAFGIDRQDIFPLQGKMSGTATQSEIMFEKAKGMAFGDLLSQLKRMFNTAILPPSLEFDFEYRDEEKDKQTAERTTVLLNNGNLLRGLGAKDEVVMNYLAQQDETLRDVLLNEDGEIIALPDDDVLDASQTDELETIETDDGTETEADANIEDGDGASAKEITDTQTTFMERFDAVYKEARAGNINRRRAGILIRGMIRTFGGRAFADGLEVGGVPRDELSDSDSSKISELVTSNSQYVSNLTEILYHGEGVTDAQADAKAVMWFNKTINPFYDAGRASADANGMYRWQLGATEEHCPDCSYMNGQVHRLKSYLDSGIHPKSNKLDCKGFRCECELIRQENARASGRILKKSLHIHCEHAA